MAVNNFGNLRTNMERIKREADFAADFGPIRDPSLDLVDFGLGDWDDIIREPLVFRFGIHKWGDTNRKVGA